jgi:hypothetical protein
MNGQSPLLAGKRKKERKERKEKEREEKARAE